MSLRVEVSLFVLSPEIEDYLINFVTQFEYLFFCNLSCNDFFLINFLSTYSNTSLIRTSNNPDDPVNRTSYFFHCVPCSPDLTSFSNPDCHTSFRINGIYLF
jgi:hypothetical protein